MGTNSDIGVDFITLTQNKLTAIKSDPVDFSQALRDDVKYQDIVYYKWDRYESVSSKQNVHIDYTKAVLEMKKLDWTFVHNHIGFKNKQTHETIQSVKIDADKWYVENLIDLGPTWDGYLWYSKTDGKHLYETVRLFFEEVPWAYVLDWKLKKVKQ